MQLGMVGLGRMGANMVLRLLKNGHTCVVFDRSPKAVEELAQQKAVGSATLQEFVKKLEKPRAVWLMVPAAAVDETIAGLLPHLESGDILIDGGNSYYVDDIRRAKELAPKEIHYVDVGTSGGVWGLERGYCMMIGGENDIVKHLDPIFATLAPGIGDIARTPGRDKASAALPSRATCTADPMALATSSRWFTTASSTELWPPMPRGSAFCAHANVGKQEHAIDAETTPLRNPEHYQYDLNLPDVAEVWRRGSVIASWLLDLTASALLKDPALSKFAGRVSDSGEGRWTIKAAIDEAVPAPVLTTALYERFSSRGEADFARQTAVGDALSVRRAPGETSREITGRLKEINMNNAVHSDALVFFGATGDLAYKKIFPALQAMIKRGHLDVPVIGVAKAGWNLDQLRARATDSLEKHGGFDPAAFEKLSGLLRYVDGDYQIRATFDALRKELGGAQHPAHYLAIPPLLFGPVVEHLANSGCAKGARVVVEKPFGSDLESAQSLNRILHATFAESNIFRIDHYLGKASGAQHALVPLRQLFLESFWNRNYVESVQITMAEDFGVQGRGAFYDETGTIRDVIQNHLFQVLCNLAMEPPVQNRQRIHP